MAELERHGHEASRRTFSIVTVSVDKRPAAALREIVDSLPGFDITSELYQWDANETALLQDLLQRRPDVCVIDFDKNRELAASRAEQIKAALPATAVFALASDVQPGSHYRGNALRLFGVPYETARCANA